MLPTSPGERLPVVSGLPRTPQAARVETNTRLVLLVVNRYFSRIVGSDPDRLADAHAAGYAGLLHAAERFDASKGFTFSTFATDIIRFFVLRFLRGERMQARLDCVSLETPVGEEGVGELADLIADPQAEKPGAAMLDDAGFERLADLADGRERELLRAVYQQERPLKDIAQEWGVSRTRIHQIQTRALKRVRRRLEWQQKQERRAGRN